MAKEVRVLMALAWVVASVLPTLAQQSVTSLTLINADSDVDIAPLVDGDTLNFALLPTTNLSVRADTDPDPVGSVRFAYDGNQNYQTESVVPYALAGDNTGDYNPWTPSVGLHTLTATPWSGSGATGTAGTALTVNFHVVSGNGGGDPPPTCAPVTNTWDVSGELMQWHPISVSFDGYCAGETAVTNPFLDYRLQVTFSHPASGTSYVVPGYFAADGDAGESGAHVGTIWRANFTPDRTGLWNYMASFREGTSLAIDSEPLAGTAVGFDGASGSFTVDPSDKSGRDLRAKGFLRHASGRYLQFDDGDYFLKGGADSPENFLAYADFDSTYNHGGTNYIKSYAAHVSDWQTGDPVWHGSKGKGIIGALNYLSSEGMNSVYFLTMNVNGDGKDVWPWTSHLERYRYDVSKLDQWEKVFSHMDRKGIMLHVLTQETENDQLLDGGALGSERKLYYRELVARFGHHLAVTWNIGEENTNTDTERKAFADYIRAIDPYGHPIVVHTFPGSKDAVYNPLLGYPTFDGPSLQMGSMSGTHSETLKWIDNSVAAGLPWFVSLDEIGPANTGVTPDGAGNNHDDVRHHALWGNLMAGGAGVEWYFGYSYAHSDLTAEDWRSRDQMWDFTRYALEFFQDHLPFSDMDSDDALSSDPSAFVFTKSGDMYAVYLPDGGQSDLTLPAGSYDIGWYDPRAGGALQQGSVANVSGGGSVSIGSPPTEPTLDWVALITLATGPPPNQPPEANASSDKASGDAPLTVHFDGSASFDTDGVIVNYDWAFGDGDVGAGVSVSHTYQTPGVFEAVLTVTDDFGDVDTDTLVISAATPPGSVVDHVASAVEVVFGSTSGSYVNTHTDGGGTQVLTEEETNGKPSRRTSRLEVRWKIPIRPNLATTLFANAWAPASEDGDAFEFDWSIDGTTFLTAFPVEASVDDDSYSFLFLGVPAADTVWVRVVDTNRNQGARDLDAVTIDHLYVRTESSGESPPPAPSGLSTTAVSYSRVDLSWDDVSGETGYNLQRSSNGGSSWATIVSLQADETTHSDTDVEPSTTYEYRVAAFNAGGSNVSATQSVTTPPPPSVHIGDLAGSASPDGKKWTASVVIEVHDAAHNAVEGAVVSGVWDRGSSQCTTDASGRCSVSQSQKPNASSVTFSVATITGMGAYDAGANDVASLVVVAAPIGKASSGYDVPERFFVDENYPDPFNPQTVIRFGLTASSDVLVEVFDAMGHRVRVVSEGQRSAGVHTVTFDGGALPSGIYVYRVRAGSTQETGTMMLVK